MIDWDGIKKKRIDRKSKNMTNNLSVALKDQVIGRKWDIFEKDIKDGKMEHYFETGVYERMSTRNKKKFINLTNQIN